jgi:hypothetical protein
MAHYKLIALLLTGSLRTAMGTFTQHHGEGCLSTQNHEPVVVTTTVGSMCHLLVPVVSIGCTADLNVCKHMCPSIHRHPVVLKT